MRKRHKKKIAKAEKIMIMNSWSKFMFQNRLNTMSVLYAVEQMKIDCSSQINAIQKLISTYSNIINFAKALKNAHRELRIEIKRNRKIVQKGVAPCL